LTAAADFMLNFRLVPHTTLSLNTPNCHGLEADFVVLLGLSRIWWFLFKSSSRVPWQKIQRLSLAWWSLAQYWPMLLRTQRKSSAVTNIPTVQKIDPKGMPIAA
jgi:hypothetical protein